MGAAGDMLAASLLEIHPDPEGAVRRLNGLGIPGVEYRLEKTVKNGITGSHLNVSIYGREEESDDGDPHGQEHSHEYEHEHHHEHEHDEDHDEHEHSHEHAHHEHEHEHYHEHAHHEHEHYHEHAHHEHEHEHHHEYDHDEHEHEHHHDHAHDHHHVHDHGHPHAHAHHSLKDIDQVVSGLKLPEPVKADIMAVYHEIAQAESHVHGQEIDQIHFHEVGTMDAVADVTAVCLLMQELCVDEIHASPVHVGSGSVRCAHGILPVPAPATAYLLRGIPSFAGEIRGELCTPTGAALLRHFVKSYGPQPVMVTERIGYGMGKKDFAQANCLRAVLGTSAEEDVTLSGIRADETVLELKCNLDDMTPEEIGYAQEILLNAGALDVFTVSIGMKKNRPGVLLTCLCSPGNREKMLKLIFTHTTTLGIRETQCSRYVLKRGICELPVKEMSVRIKTASGWGVSRAKPEYEDLAQIAGKEGISLREAARLLEQGADVSHKM